MVGFEDPILTVVAGTSSICLSTPLIAWLHRGHDSVLEEDPVALRGAFKRRLESCLGRLGFYHAENDPALHALPEAY